MYFVVLFIVVQYIGICSFTSSDSRDSVFVATVQDVAMENRQELEEEIVLGLKLRI